MKNETKITFLMLWMLLLTSFFLMAFNDTINTALPAGSDSPAEADDNMRRIQGGFQELGNVEHDYSLTATVITGDGTHTAITTTSIVNAGTLANTGDLSVNTDKFTVAASSGNTLVAGTLDVTGNIDPTTYETTNGGFLNSDTMSGAANDTVASSDSIKNYAGGGAATPNNSAAAALVDDEVYLAQTAGFVTFFANNITTSGNVQCLVGAANPPTTTIILIVQVPNPGDVNGTFFVGSGKFFEVQQSAAAIDTIHWTPLVVGGGAPILQ